MNECLIRIEIAGELVISAEICLEGIKQGLVFGKNDLLEVEKAAVCRGLANLAAFRYNHQSSSLDLVMGGSLGWAF